ncbi:prohibitin family protein [Legionella brunensis]|uniref:SPFH domain / Band 7 family protein n=1 Tax=Legionella brunensis TaxID=29422 RepID=A0A0W0ST66_9GAMM|nr:prohibitin family protein [Legionella brunensis]KTC86586.1 SPFH domain / Band 7 family protein [Legionella brunensis]
MKKINPIFIPLLFVIFLFFIISTVSIIPVGYVGIPVLFGRVQTGYLDPGIHFTNPFTRVVKFDLRTQKADEEGVIPSKEMLNLTLKTSVNYHLNKSKIVDIYSSVGVDYFDKLIEPHIRSSIRQITSNYNAEQFFSGDRNEIASNIQKSLIQELEPRGVVIESIMLKEILPPESIRLAIENKQAQQQEAEGMKFRLQREKLEAERKKIEAEGIQQFQEIVKRGIDQNLLAWKGIEATEALAKSPNAKIIIIGNNDKGGLPLIMPTNN